MAGAARPSDVECAFHSRCDRLVVDCVAVIILHTTQIRMRARDECKPCTNR